MKRKILFVLAFAALVAVLATFHTALLPELDAQLPRVIWPRENFACLNGNCFADAFPGATVTEQIANCLADAAPQNGTCIVPAKMGAGAIPTVPAGSTLLDLRNSTLRLGDKNRLRIGALVNPFFDPDDATVYIGTDFERVGLHVEASGTDGNPAVSITSNAIIPAGVGSTPGAIGFEGAATLEGTGPLGQAYGVAANAVAFSGTITVGAGLWSLCNSNNSGTNINTCSGLDVDRISTVSGGTITNAYGVRIRSISSTGVTNRYAFYAGGSGVAGAPVRIPDVTFSSLPTGSAAENGSMLYCTNCTRTDPCASGGTGAFAKRIAGAWVCN